ncbi:MAG: acetyl-CoA carboxylase carboxyltransferase subunit alpha [Clostridiales bacterium]
MLKEVEGKLEDLEAQITAVEKSQDPTDIIVLKQLKNNHKELMEYGWENLNAADRVYLARHPKRPNSLEYIENLFSDFFPLHGDRLSGDDESILGGIASYHEIPVTVLAQCKGKNLEENLKYNFGMPSPSGYRKAQRLVKQAEKFCRPIITFIDTPGAYPGLDAEAKGQGEAIASCLSLFSSVKVPVIAIIIGEGGSGGALALALANTLIMLENSIYSILSPEGFATILWKDGKKSDEAANLMKLTAEDLKTLGTVDYIIPEGIGGAHRNKNQVFTDLDTLLYEELTKLLQNSGEDLANARYEKFRNMGNFSTDNEEKI